MRKHKFTFVLPMFMACVMLPGCRGDHGAFDGFDGDSFSLAEKLGHLFEKPPIDVSRHSGRELYAGIFYVKGRVAASVPTIRASKTFYELSKMQQIEKAEADRKIEKTLDAIEKEHPGYFENFKATLKSKNHLLISKALSDGAKLLFETSVDLFLSETQKEDLDALVAKIKIDEHLNPDGSMDYESLKEFIVKEYTVRKSVAPNGLFVVVPAAVAAYFAVVHGIAIMTYAAIAWVAGVAGAVGMEFAVWRERYVTSGSEATQASTRWDITHERLVNDLASMEY